MKKIIAICFSLLLSSVIQAQGIFDKINHAIKKDSSSSVITQITKQISSETKGTSLSNEDIINGLKEALTIGTNNSTKKLGAADGFFNDAILKIMMPEEAEKVASAKDPSTKPKINKPLLDQNVSLTIVKHPLKVSKPSRRAGKILK